MARALLGSVLSCLPLALPAAGALLGPAAETHRVGLWLQPADLAKWVVVLLRDRWIVWDLLSTLVPVIAGALALLRWGGLRLEPRLAWPAAAWLTAFVLLPRQVNGSDYMGTRILPYAAALFLAAIDTESLAPGRRRAIALIAAAFFATRMLGNTAGAIAYDREWRAELAALDHIPYGARVATFTPSNCGSSFGNWRNPRIAHLSAMATVRRDAFVNSLWTLSALQLLRVHYPAAGAFTSEPSQSLETASCGPLLEKPLPLVLARLPRSAFDQVWLIGWPPETWPHAAWLHPLWAGADSVLLEILPSRARDGKGR